MAVIIVFFNPAQSLRMIQNILMVKYYLEAAGIPLYIGELAFDENPFLFKPAGNVFQYRSTSYMFYKENLAKIVESNISKVFKKLCFLDADIMFSEPNWYSIVSKALDKHDICQVYTKRYSLGIDYCVTKEEAGNAWACRRTQTVVIDEYTVFEPQKRKYPHSCDLTAYHLHHGAPSNRRPPLIPMKELMQRLHVTSVKEMLTRDEEDILIWKPRYRTDANTIMQTYFWNRFDDGMGGTSIKFFPESYDTPHTRDMAIILVFFNPVPYVRILQNILTIRHMLDLAEIPYYIAELTFEDQQFVFKPDANVIHFRSSSYMFYKENLIRVVERIIPPSFTKLCIMDADVIFDKPNWYHIVSNTLNRVEVCQPFKMCYWMNLHYQVLYSRTNCLDAKSGDINWEIEHPGFVWAFRRSWKGLIPYLNVDISTIGGDTLLHYIIKKNNTNSSMIYKTEGISAPSYASCNLSLYHLSHGSRENRKYYNIIKETRKILDRYQLKKMEDLVYCRGDGIIEWLPEYADTMNTFMKEYFRSRLEDNP